MQQELAADDDWFPAVRFADGGPLLGGEVSYPLPSFLTADQALGLAQSADRLISWATAMRIRAVARVEEAVAEEVRPRDGSQPVRFGGDEAHALAVTEVATACALSEGSAAQSLNDAAELTTCQWEVLEAVEEGKISPAHARVILEQARSLPAAHHGEFSRIALLRTRTRHGRLRTAVELRTCLRRTRERLHPESLSSRKASARRERGVWFTPEQDGMCTFTAFLPAETGLAIFNGLDRDARLARARAAETDTYQVAGTASAPGSPTPSRTLPEYRADALAYRLLGGSGDGIGPFRPEVVVTIPVGQVLADVPAAAPLAFEAGATGPRTAELQGYGPIDADTALKLAALAPNWHRLFTDFSTGKALGVGRTAYRPPQVLLRYLHSRDGTCRFPGCTRPARGCEVDHTVEWQDGGHTEPGNLALLCRRHHALKSIGAWSYEHLSHGGDLRWRSALGRTYSTGAEDAGAVDRDAGRAETAEPASAAKPPVPPPF